MTANDSGDTDEGPNHLQNFPVLTSIPGGVQIALNSAPNVAYVLEFFANTACDASGNGEGQFFLGTTTATTDGGGNLTVPFVGSPTGLFVTATATDGNGSTSDSRRASHQGPRPTPISRLRRPTQQTPLSPTLSSRTR